MSLIPGPLWRFWPRREVDSVYLCSVAHCSCDSLHVILPLDPNWEKKKKKCHFKKKPVCMRKVVSPVPCVSSHTMRAFEPRPSSESRLQNVLTSLSGERKASVKTLTIIPD